MKCSRCNQETEGTSCVERLVHIPFIWVLPAKWNHDDFLTCPCCGCKQGGYHHEYCDIEECPQCDDQAFGNGCRCFEKLERFQWPCCGKGHNAKSCDSKRVIRFPDGILLKPLPYEGNQRCFDCGVIKGKYHHPGCSIEDCPQCNEQIITCRCFDKNPTIYPVHDRIELIALRAECNPCDCCGGAAKILGFANTLLDRLGQKMLG